MNFIIHEMDGAVGIVTLAKPPHNLIDNVLLKVRVPAPPAKPHLKRLLLAVSGSCSRFRDESMRGAVAFARVRNIPRVAAVLHYEAHRPQPTAQVVPLNPGDQHAYIRSKIIYSTGRLSNCTLAASGQ